MRCNVELEFFTRELAGFLEGGGHELTIALCKNIYAMQSNVLDFLVNLSAREHAARSVEETLEIPQNAMKRCKCIENAQDSTVVRCEQHLCDAMPCKTMF